MQVYEILVKNRAVKGNSSDMTLVRTSVGIDQVHVLFDSAEWLDFPVTITFAQGDELVTQSLLLTSIDSADWVAESTVTVPYEVIDMNGPIRVTIQGTDAEGRHIITAKGSPLSVEEAGDVVIGEPPESAPTTDQWQQAYSQAMAAANAAQSVANDIEGRIEDIVSDAEARIVAAVGTLPIATGETLGGVIVGNNINVDENGRISIPQYTGITPEQTATILNLSNLAYYCFDSEFDGNGTLLNTIKVKRTAIPVATSSGVGAVKVDGTTVLIGADGTISVPEYSIPIADDDVVGGIMSSDTVNVDGSGVATVPLATVQSLGLVRPDGVTITIDDGVITASGGGGSGGYVLPKATDGQLGGIRVGNGLTIDADGVLSVDIDSADGMVF